jgi:hypothetical protein
MNPKKRKIIYWYFTKKPTIEELEEQIKEWEVYIIEHKALIKNELCRGYRIKNMIRNFKRELRIFKHKLKEMKQNVI